MSTQAIRYHDPEDRVFVPRTRAARIVRERTRRHDRVLLAVGRGRNVVGIKAIKGELVVEGYRPDSALKALNLAEGIVLAREV